MNQFFNTLLQSQQADGVLSSGWNFIDRQMEMGGIAPDRLIGFYGRPKVGKTYFLVNWMHRLALAGCRSYFFSAEMSELDILYRFLSLISKIEKIKIFEQMEDEGFRPYINKCCSWLQNWVKIDRCLPLTTKHIENVIVQNSASQAPPHYYFIDHHLLIDSGVGKQFDQVNQVISSLANLKSHFGLRVVLTIQVNRGGGDGSWLPSLADGKGSGAIEEALDVVVAACRPEISEKCPDNDRGKIKVVVEGNRFGGSGNPVLFPYDEITGEIREVIW